MEEEHEDDNEYMNQNSLISNVTEKSSLIIAICHHKLAKKKTQNVTNVIVTLKKLFNINKNANKMEQGRDQYRKQINALSLKGNRASRGRRTRRKRKRRNLNIIASRIVIFNFFQRKISRNVFGPVEEKGKQKMG